MVKDLGEHKGQLVGINIALCPAGISDYDLTQQTYEAAQEDRRHHDNRCYSDLSEKR